MFGEGHAIRWECGVLVRPPYFGKTAMRVWIPLETEMGSLAAPHFSAFRFAVAAFFSAPQAVRTACAVCS